MIRFACDYAEGAHPRILEQLMATNEEQTPGYGEDIFCERARERIQKLCGDRKADVHFLVGGTQTNMTVIASLLKPHQGVISAHTGHISIHETGAVEATGHKVLPIQSVDGTITAQQVRAVYDAHWADADHEHMVQPGMVYVSHPTENGTMYTKKQLTELYAVCRELGLPLFVDGARLGYGLAAARLKEDGDGICTIEELAERCDIFYIGGTKVGALFGEAVVIMDPAYGKDFRYLIKQKGGMLAKGRLLGIQFDVLMQDDLYMSISAHAVSLALRIRKALQEAGFSFLYESDTNQQFPILPDDLLRGLEKSYAFAIWSKVDEEHTAVRICTSWATKEKDVDALIADLKGMA